MTICRTQFSPSTMWVLGLELRLSDWTFIEPSCQPYLVFYAYLIVGEGKVNTHTYI
jgi:predicted hotdog family 3-hydroxylacyl-ACP dehydratase